MKTHLENSAWTDNSYLKGTVARDFSPLVFSTNRPHIVPEFTPWNIFEFCFEFAEIFVFKVVPRGVIPRRTSVCYKICTSLSLFSGVWNPARLGSAGSDTPQDLVLRGLIPRRILFCGVSDPTGKLRPRGIRWSFESLPFSLKGHFENCQHKNYTTQGL